MSGEAPSPHQRVAAAMTSFGIVVLVGAAVALYLCTPQADAAGMAPGRAIALGFSGAAIVFGFILVVTLGATLAGIGDAAEQLRAKGKVSTPRWIAASVTARTALVYLLYGWLGFALGGVIASTLQLLQRGA